MYAVFPPIGSKRFIFEKVYGLPCYASLEEGHGEGIVSKGLLSMRISIQSGEATYAIPWLKKKKKKNTRKNSRLICIVKRQLKTL